MSTDDGDGGGYIEPDGEAAVPQPGPRPAPEPEPASPGRQPGVPAWKRGPWWILIALIGAAAIAGVVVAVVSSGGGNKNSSPTSTSTGNLNGAYIRKADAICATLDPPINADYRTAFAAITAGNIARAQKAARALNSAAGTLIDRIKALGPPPQDASVVNQIVADYTLVINDVIANTPESIQRAQAIAAQIESLATHFGFQVCGLT